MTETSCPYHAASTPSIDALSRLMRACVFPKADITRMARQLREGAAPPPPSEAADVSGLKVEKNALALLYIPGVMDHAQAFLDQYPDQLVILAGDQMNLVDMTQLSAVLRPRNPHAELCGYLYSSMRNAMQYAVASALAEVATDDPLLDRYRRALGLYHGHTSEAATHFHPGGHLMAGVNTALFFILRGLAALTVLGGRVLGRPVTADELAAGMEQAAPLLLTIARCHLDLLLALEGPLGKGDDLFLAALPTAEYHDSLAAMFTVTAGADGLRLEIAPAVLAQLTPLSGEKPRTGCPALYASTADNVNAIVALVRLTTRAYALALDHSRLMEPA